MNTNFQNVPGRGVHAASPRERQTRMANEAG
jgi:hypothetical protein